MNLIQLFIFLQVILFFFMAFHDWVHLPPLTDIRALEKNSTFKGRVITSTIFAIIVLIPLFLTWFYQPDFPLWVLVSIVLDYGFLTLGTIFSWWAPYFFGSFSQEHKAAFTQYQNTHHFLPPIGDNVIPNTFHVLLHFQIWVCFGIAIYLLLS